jgi:ABC-type nickel/cobalt efflux system permease component RcnA
MNMKQTMRALIIAAVAAVSLSGCIWVRGEHHDDRDRDHDQMHEHDHDYDHDSDRDDHHGN